MADPARLAAGVLWGRYGSGKSQLNMPMGDASNRRPSAKLPESARYDKHRSN